MAVPVQDVETRAGKAESPTPVWFVYVLRCSDATLYTGITTDVARRCTQHDAGTASRYTRSRLPVRVEYHEMHGTQSSALKREAAIKAMSRGEKESLIRSAADAKRAPSHRAS